MKKIKWIIIGLVSLLFCFFLSEIFTKKNLDDRAEFKMAQSFLRSSSEVKKEFGDVQNLAYRRKFSKIIWNDGLASGEYAFELEGTK